MLHRTHPAGSLTLPINQMNKFSNYDQEMIIAATIYCGALILLIVLLIPELSSKPLNKLLTLICLQFNRKIKQIY